MNHFDAGRHRTLFESQAVPRAVPHCNHSVIPVNYKTDVIITVWCWKTWSWSQGGILSTLVFHTLVHTVYLLLISPITQSCVKTLKATKKTNKKPHNKQWFRSKQNSLHSGFLNAGPTVHLPVHFTTTQFSIGHSKKNKKNKKINKKQNSFSPSQFVSAKWSGSQGDILLTLSSPMLVPQFIYHFISP